MGLLKGSTSIHRFEVLGPKPSFAGVGDGISPLGLGAFRVPADGAWEIASGFAGPFGPFSPVEDFQVTDSHVVFGFRVDTRRVPAATLNAHVENRIKAIFREFTAGFIGKEARLSIKDEVKAELLRRVLPAPRVYEIAWNAAKGELLVFGASGTVLKMIASALMKAFGVELRRKNYWPAGADSSMPFLPWLWRRGIEHGGTSGAQDDHSALFVEDALVFAGEQGDVKEISLSHGNPAESDEAFELLSKEMDLVKSKMRLLSGDLEWVFTLGAGEVAFNAVKLPPTTAKQPEDRLVERLFLVAEFLGHMDRRWEQMPFVEPGELQHDLIAWAMGHQFVQPCPTLTAAEEV